MRSVLCLLAFLAAPQLSNAALIYETMPVPTTGAIGGAELSSQYLGTRFQLTEATAITAVGGHFQSTAGATLFAAIVPLASMSALPTSGDIESIALASATFTATHPSSILTIGLTARLDPGIYGLVYGGKGSGPGAFGATGVGSMPLSVSPPGASNFFRLPDGTWLNGGVLGVYFSVFGDVAVTSVPEPASLSLLAAGLLLTAGFAKRRKA